MSTLIVSSVAFDRSVAGHVLVTYNQNVDATDAATTGNYSIPGLTVTGASYSNPVATLTVTGYTFGTSYTATVSNVRDSGHSQTIANPNNFYGFVLGGGTGMGGEAFAVGEGIALNIQHAQRTFNLSDTVFGPPGTVRHQGSKINPGTN